MPNLLNRFKHEEFKSNSAFQISNQKERRSKRGVEEDQKSKSNFAPCAKFSPTLLTFCNFYSLFPIFALHVYKCELRVFLYFSFGELYRSSNPCKKRRRFFGWVENTK